MPISEPLLPKSVNLITQFPSRGGGFSGGVGRSTTSNQSSVTTDRIVAKYVATSNVALSGVATIDGNTPTTGDRILTVGQSSAVENRLWVYNGTGAWSAATDSLTAGMSVRVQSGTLFGNSVWSLTTTGLIIPGTTSLAWTADWARVAVRMNSAGSVYYRRRINMIAGTGISLGLADDSANEEIDVTINATATLDGGGTAGYLALWSDSDTLTSSTAYETGSNIGIGITSSLAGRLHVKSTTATAALRVENTFSGNAVDVSLSGAGSGVAVSHVGTGSALTITKSSSGRGVTITQSGTGEGVRITTSGNNTSLVVSSKDGTTLDLYRDFNVPNAPMVSIVEEHSSANQTTIAVRNDGIGTTLSVIGGNGAIADLSRNVSSPSAPLVNILEDNGSANQTVVAIRNDGTGTTLQTNTAGTGSAYKAQDNGTTFLDLKDGKVIDSTNGGRRLNTTTKSAAYTLTESDHVLFYNSGSASANVTITLPSPASKIGQHYIIIDISGNASVRNMILARSGTEKIDNVGGNKTFNTNKFRVEVITDGTDWFTW